MDNRITLTREEVREARRAGFQPGCFLSYAHCPMDPAIMPLIPNASFMTFCHLCKRLTEFAKGEEDE